MKDWFDSAPLVEDATVEVAFLLFPDFYYGPDRSPDVVERKELEPLRIPAFARFTERLATTAEVEPHVEELIRYYADVVRLGRKYGMSFDRIRQYFWLRLGIFNPDRSFHVAFPWYDTLGEMEGLLTALSKPPVSGEVHWDRDQCWELEADASDDMLYVREGDPDHEEVRALGKLPLLALASSSQATLLRARRIIASLSEALSEDVWTSHKASATFSRLSL